MSSAASLLLPKGLLRIMPINVQTEVHGPLVVSQYDPVLHNIFCNYLLFYIIYSASSLLSTTCWECYSATPLASEYIFANFLSSISLQLQGLESIILNKAKAEIYYKEAVF